MAETYTTTAVAVVYRVSMILLDLGEQMIRVTVREWTGTAFVNGSLTVGYEGQTAIDLITQLNKANLTTTSLQRRILNQLVTDGKLPAGNAGGTVD